MRDPLRGMNEPAVLEAVAACSTEASAIAALAERAATPVDINGEELLAVRLAPGDAFSIADLEQYAPVPRRKRGRFTVTDPDSLVAYAKRHLTRETQLWGDRNAGRLAAIFDDHEAGENGGAGWGAHRVELHLARSVEWQTWTQRSGRPMTQVDFAELVEERAQDIVEPTGAEMLEIAQSLHATKSAAFRSDTRLSNGETRLVYEETLDARAGQRGDLIVPTRFALALRVWEGTQPYRVEARFRYRLTDGRLSIAFILDRLDDVVREAFGELAADVADKVGAPLFHGTPADDRAR